MQEERRGYAQAASEATEQTTAWARDVAAMLIGQGLQWSARAPELVSQAQQAVEDVMSGLKGNREMITEIAAEQVDRAVGRLGLVQQDEIAALRARLERLEAQVATLVSASRVTPAHTGESAASGPGPRPASETPSWSADWTSGGPSGATPGGSSGGASGGAAGAASGGTYGE